jgi:hypothetical protein
MAAERVGFRFSCGSGFGGHLGGCEQNLVQGLRSMYMFGLIASQEIRLQDQ